MDTLHKGDNDDNNNDNNSKIIIIIIITTQFGQIYVAVDSHFHVYWNCAWLKLLEKKCNFNYRKSFLQCKITKTP